MQPIRPAPHHLSLPVVAFVSLLLRFSSALLVAWLTGLGVGKDVGYFIWATMHFVVWSTPVLSSLTLLVCSFSDWWTGTPRGHRSLLCLAIGGAHGYIWYWVSWQFFMPEMAAYKTSFAAAWSISGIIGFLAILLVQRCTWSISAWSWRFLSTLFLVLFSVYALLASCVLSLFLWLGDGVTQHEVTSPDQRMVALVIRGDCGATCSCAIRVDLQTHNNYYREVYRSEACDATVRWLSQTELDIHDDLDHHKHVDISTLE